MSDSIFPGYSTGQYFLMNKDRQVASFTIETSDLGEKISIIKQNIPAMPIGFDNMAEWISRRKASKHNRHLRELMTRCGCNTAEGFIRVTHAASINDTFWIKSAEEDVQWDNISLYKNEFNETISKLAFEGIGLYGVEFSSTSPELSTEGSFRKCWRREDGQIFLYKRGSTGAKNAGLEPYGEVLASEIASKICPESVRYEIAELHGQIASKCKLFTDEKNGYVPISRYVGRYSDLSGILNFYEKIGAEEDFRRMAVLDAITFNVDRHMGNYGVLIDNDTLETKRMAPIFDFNLALLPYLVQKDFSSIGDSLLGYSPCIGEDFTRIGQVMLTPAIRSDLKSLKGFTFTYRGNDQFPEERVKALEQIVNKQVDAVLSQQILYTKDVFIPEEFLKDKAETRLNQEEQLKRLGKEIEKLPNVECSFSHDESTPQLVIRNRNIPNIEIQIFGDFSMSIENDGIEISYADCLMENPQAAKWYVDVANIVDGNEVEIQESPEISR